MGAQVGLLHTEQDLEPPRADPLPAQQTLAVLWGSVRPDRELSKDVRGGQMSDGRDGVAVISS